MTATEPLPGMTPCARTVMTGSESTCSVGRRPAHLQRFDREFRRRFDGCEAKLKINGNVGPHGDCASGRCAQVAVAHVNDGREYEVADDGVRVDRDDEVPVRVVDPDLVSVVSPACRPEQDTNLLG